jgi:hypothetical protein
MPGYARSQTSLFADDCLMYRKVSSTSDSTQLQEDLDNLIKWEQQWQMQFNPDKCEVLTITKKRKPLHHDYTIHGHILQHVDSTKYLGLNISKNLSWNTHVDAITKKANNTLAFLRRNIGTEGGDRRSKRNDTKFEFIRKEEEECGLLCTSNVHCGEKGCV